MWHPTVLKSIEERQGTVRLTKDASLGRTKRLAQKSLQGEHPPMQTLAIVPMLASPETDSNLSREDCGCQIWTGHHDPCLEITALPLTAWD
jgi:hypothetical protein